MNQNAENSKLFWVTPRGVPEAPTPPRSKDKNRRRNKLASFIANSDIDFYTLYFNCEIAIAFAFEILEHFRLFRLMDFRRRPSSSDSDSDSDERDTVHSLFREFRNRPGGVNYYEQRNVRRDRHLERCLSWSIYEDSSLNLATLFYDVGGDELKTPPFYSVARRYCIRHE